MDDMQAREELARMVNQVVRERIAAYRAAVLPPLEKHEMENDAVLVALAQDAEACKALALARLHATQLEADAWLYLYYSAGLLGLYMMPFKQVVSIGMMTARHALLADIMREEEAPAPDAASRDPQKAPPAD